jgi:hypothetical protein
MTANLASVASTINTVGGAMGSVASGISQSRAYGQQAGYIKAQSAIAKEEATLAMIQKQREINQYQAEQKMAYLKSGVTLEGSPLIMLAETRRLGQEELDAMARRATAIDALYSVQASQARQSGRAALVGGIASGLMYGANNFLQAKGSGVYRPTSTTSAAAPTIFQTPQPQPTPTRGWSRGGYL